MIYQWTFEVKGDVIKFEETEITVFADTYENAIKKVRSLRIPSLKTYDNIEEHLKLSHVIECESEEIDDDFEEVKN